MSSPDILFKGIPRGRTRGYTADTLRAVKPERVVIPCTGSFSLAVVAMAAGVPPDRIVCGDISLYSTAIGHAIMGTDWRLALRPQEVERSEVDLVRPLVDGSPVDKAVAVLYVVRVQQYRNAKPSVHTRDFLAEILSNAALYQGHIRAGVERIVTELRGLTYTPRDMWDTLEEHRHDAGTVLLTNPPRYSGGYDRMFKGVDGIFEWDPPEAKQFTEDDYVPLMALLGDSPALTLMYYATPAPDEDPADLWGHPWSSVFADKPGSSKTVAINWIVSNRQVIPPVVSRAALADASAQFRLFEGEITEQSVLTIKKVSPIVGQYYRDLFVHRLATGATERYIALLVDGRLLGVVGLHMAAYYGRQSRKSLDDRKPGLTFAFTVPHSRYDRLGKLTLLSVCSKEFWQLTAEPKMEFMGLPTALDTKMLTKHPENKTSRGIMKLVRREPYTEGGFTYKLTYEGPVVDRTLKDAKQEWLKKFAPKQKSTSS